MHCTVLFIAVEGSVGSCIANRMRILRPGVTYHIIPTCASIANALPANAIADEAWMFPDPDPLWTCKDHDPAFLASAGVKVLNIVMEGGPCARGHPGGEQTVIERCSALGLLHRIFHIPAVLNDPLTAGGLLGQFFRTLHEFELEIEERARWFFEFYALHCRAVESAAIEIVRPDDVAEAIIKISSRGQETVNQCFTLPPSAAILVAELCQNARIVCRSNLVPTSDANGLNAIDLAFESRLIEPFLKPPLWRERTSTNGVATLNRTALTLLWEALEAQRMARDRRVAGMAESLECITLSQRGFPLTYYAAGRGQVPILLLNALGQSVVYWLRLIDELMKSHRVIVWEPRGVTLPPHPFTLRDQADDIQAILESENADCCSLIGWCTGPKVAVEFCLRNPKAVNSMIFLNATFRCAETPSNLETQYERNSEPLFRLVAQRPEMANSVSKALQNSVQHLADVPENEDDGSDLPADLFGAMNGALREHVTAPFRSDVVIANYAQQIVDFWSHDTLSVAPRVAAPVLLLASDHDLVAAPEMSRHAARCFPKSRFELLPFASHYCLYDRPRFVANLVNRFLAEASTSGAVANGLVA